MRLPILAIALLLAAALPAPAAESIVGTWATPGRCGRPLSTIAVSPMALAGEDFFCDFTEVSRKDDTVRWRGICTFGVDEEKASVTARLERGRLSYQFHRDGWNGPLQRCP